MSKHKKQKRDKHYSQYENDVPGYYDEEPRSRKTPKAKILENQTSSKKSSNFNVPSSLDFSGRPRAVENAMVQHKRLVQNYLRYYGGKIEDLKPDTSSYRTDLDVVRDNHRFIWDSDNEEDDIENPDNSANQNATKTSKQKWEERVSKHYWDRLNKEYCIGDLSRYKEKMYAFRWRTENEVVEGTGQFTCGNKVCKKFVKKGLDELSSFEVMFNYKERGEKKSALVKIRVCEKCERKLNYHHKHKKAKKRKKKDKKEKAEKDRKQEYDFKEEGGIKEEAILIDSDDDTSHRDKSHRDKNRSRKRSRSKSPENVQKNNETHWNLDKPGNSKSNEEKRTEQFDDYLNDLLM